MVDEFFHRTVQGSGKVSELGGTADFPGSLFSFRKAGCHSAQRHVRIAVAMRLAGSRAALNRSDSRWHTSQAAYERRRQAQFVDREGLFEHFPQRICRVPMLGLEPRCPCLQFHQPLFRSSGLLASFQVVLFVLPGEAI